MNIFNRIYITSSARYNVLNSIDAIEADALYFVEDLTTKCQLIYMGQNKIGGSFIVENNGYPTEPKCGVIYYISGISGEESDFVGFYDGSKWVSFFDGSNFVTKDKLIEVEEVVANTISKIIESTGIVNSDGVIDYNHHSDANYISTANSIDEATVLLDAQLGNVYSKGESDGKYQVKGNYLTEESDPIWTADKVNYYTKDDVDGKFVTNETVIANEEVVANTFDKVVSGSGLVNSEGEIGYNQHSTANYISSATSIDEATVLLDSAIKGVENGYVKTNSDASLKSIQLSDGTNTSKVYTMTEGGVPTTYFENMNNGRLYLTGSDDSLGQIILDAKNIHPWSTGGFGNMGTAGNPWAYTYSNNVYTDRLASKNGTLWVQGLINNGNPNNGGTIDNVYFKANNVCPGSKDPSNNLGTTSFPWKTLNAIEATIGKANGAYGQNTITKGVLKFQNSTNSNTTIQPSATSNVSLSLPFSSGTIALTSDTVDSANQLKIYEASLDGYYPLTMVESSSNLPKYESLFTKTNIKYNPVQNILETGRVHAHTYTYSEHPENASLVVYNSLDSGSQESIYTSMRPRVGFIYYDNHVDDRYCGQIVMDKDGYTLYRGTSDNSKNPDGTWKGTNDSVYKASNGGTPYAELKCGEIKAYVNDTWRNVISELDSVNILATKANTTANSAFTAVGKCANTSFSNLTDMAKYVIRQNTGIYIAEYAKTPLQNVLDAIKAGAKILVNFPNNSSFANVEVLSYSGTEVHFLGFRSTVIGEIDCVRIALNDMGWNTVFVLPFENKNSKKSTITNSTTYYPNNKAVIDYVAPIKEKVDSLSNEWYGTQEEFDALTEYQEGVNYYIYD